MPKKNWTVPIRPDGSQKTYTGDWEFKTKTGIKKGWRFLPADTELELFLEFETVGKWGRSACGARFSDLNSGATYECTLGEFEKMVPYIVDGRILGIFGFVKRGSSISLSYLRRSNEKF